MEVFVKEEIRKHRADLCMSCENISMINTCNLCNCYMPLKIKLPGAYCPDHKWPAVDSDQPKYTSDESPQ